MLLCYYLRAMELTNGILVTSPSSPSNVLEIPQEEKGVELQRDV